MSPNALWVIILLHVLSLPYISFFLLTKNKLILSREILICYISLFLILPVITGLVWFMVHNATFNNISVILWLSVLLVEEAGVPGENQRHVASH
jgi:hypothetical protein